MIIMFKKSLVFLALLLFSSISFASVFNISDCSNLSTLNSEYDLNTSINLTGGNCMNITATNVTLDLQGNYINITNMTSGSIYGINVLNTYATIKNGTIYQNQTTSVSAFYGIYAVTSKTNLSIYDLNIYMKGNSSYCGYVYSSSNGFNITRTICRSSGTTGSGWYFRSSTGNICDNDISATSYDIYYRSTIINVCRNKFNVTTNDGVEIYIYTGSKGLNLSDNNFTSTKGEIFSFGGYSCATDFNQSIDITNTENGEPILYIYNQSDVNVSDTNNYSLIFVACSYGAYVHNNTMNSSGITVVESDNALIDGNKVNIIKTYTNGINLWYSLYGNVTNNLINTSTGSQGIYFASANNTLMDNCTLLGQGSSTNPWYVYNSFNITLHNIFTKSTGTSGYNYNYLNDNITIQDSFFNTSAAVYPLYWRYTNNSQMNNITIICPYTFCLYEYGSVNNAFKNNNVTATGAGSYPIYVSNNTLQYNYNNTFYNNYLYGLNYSPMFVTGYDMGVSGHNDWNTTLQAGTRKYSNGWQIGGNYYDNASGGYSGSCTDADVNGFCDSPLNMTNRIGCIVGIDCGNNTDYLVMSDKFNDTDPPDIGDCYFTDISIGIDEKTDLICNVTDEMGIDSFYAYIEMPGGDINSSSFIFVNYTDTPCGNGYVCYTSDIGGYKVISLWTNDTWGNTASINFSSIKYLFVVENKVSSRQIQDDWSGMLLIFFILGAAAVIFLLGSFKNNGGYD
jgi:hypothetical protein